MIKYINTLLCFLVFISCRDYSGINLNYNKISTCKLEFVQDKEILLPDKSSNYRLPIQYLEYKGEKYILCFDRFDNKLYVINYETIEVIQSIKFDIEHAHQYKDFYAISLDSILLLEYHANSVIYFTNTTGKLVDKFPLGKNKGFLISSSQEPLWHDKKLILSGYTMDDKNKTPETSETMGGYPFAFIYDTKTQQYILENNFNYPDFYYKYNWGWGNYREPYSHTHNNTILYSLPASHEVYCYDAVTHKMTKFDAGSSFIKEIVPFAKHKSKYIAAAKIDYLKYFLSNPSYYKILYDNYRKIYYRIAGLPSDKVNLNDINTYRKKVSVIMFDEKFNFLGETLLDEHHEPYRTFVNEDGLHILYNYDPTKKVKFKIYKPQLINHK
jgi:hypothetical protein